MAGESGSTWADTLNNLADNITEIAVASLAQPATPVATDAKTGQSYTEGQPHYPSAVAGIPTMYLIGGAVLLGAVAFFALRK